MPGVLVAAELALPGVGADADADPERLRLAHGGRPEPERGTGDLVLLEEQARRFRAIIWRPFFVFIRARNPSFRARVTLLILWG